MNKKFKSINKQVLVTAIIMLALGGVGGYFMKGGGIEMEMSSQSDEDKKPLYYRNPMNPEITSATPAKDYMGMDYIPVYEDSDEGEGESPGTVKIDSTTVQNIGVRSKEAKIGNLSHTIRAVGKITFDEERMAKIHPKTEGWIDELYVNKTGENVKEDTILLNIYSPKLVSTQQEYLLALSNFQSLKNSKFPDIKKGAKELLKSTYERLELLDVPEHQIKELEKTRKVKKNLHIHSPVAGTVTRIGAREGQYVTPATELYMISDLSKVWVHADIYEYEIQWVKVGDKVDMSLEGVPGKIFKGELTYIYPYAESKTRTIKVRLEFDNPDQALRPEMFAKVNIHAGEQKNVVIIPSEAVIKSGVHNQVFIVKGKGKFEPRKVILGLESNGKVIVRSGVEEGEVVVTSSQFLIDSESKLNEATSKMQEVEGSNAREGKHDH